MAPLQAGQRAGQAQRQAAYGRWPLNFEANQGQTDGQVKFLARGRSHSIFLAATEVVLVLSGSPALPPVAVRMMLMNSNPAPEIIGLEELAGKVHYFVGNDPGKWRTGTPTFAKVRYRDVYPGVDVVFYGTQGTLEDDFVIAPGADPSTIVLGFGGAERVEVNTEGDLVLDTARGQLRLSRPRVYQDVEGRRQIAGRYVLVDEHRVGFSLAAYDATRPLIIDPVLVYSTYLGGGGSDGGADIAVDSSGSVYVTGSTASVDFPLVGPFQSANAGGNAGPRDAYVMKLNPAGDALVYATYLGGGGDDHGLAIAVDASGNAYVTGDTTSLDFPLMNPVQPSRGGPGTEDAFVTELNPAGNALMYSTYLGGSSAERGNGIAVDSSGGAYVTGYTESTDFPTTPQAVQPFRRTFDWNTPRDAFVTKFDPAGLTLAYSTYLGGASNDSGVGIAVDGAGNAYVTGGTGSQDFPMASPPSSSATGAFVVKLDATGSRLVYSTFLGGSSGAGIAVDAEGHAYVTGWTNGSGFPVVNALQPTVAGGLDAFVTKLSPDGSAPLYSTFLGGGAEDRGNRIAVDSLGNAYVVGTTRSVDFPAVNAIQATYGGSDDAFVSRLDSIGSALVYSTYLGGSSYEGGTGIAVDAAGGTYVTGFTWSMDFPTANPFRSASGAADSFVAKIASTASLPGQIEAEDFDHGGEGVAYHDLTPGNQGGQYRADVDVDIIAPASGGYVINNFQTGEWLQYTISVAQTGTYRLDLLVSSEFTTSRWRAEIDGVPVTGSVLVPSTGNWLTFQWAGVGGIRVTGGQHLLRIVADQQYFNFAAFRILAE